MPLTNEPQNAQNTSLDWSSVAKQFANFRLYKMETFNENRIGFLSPKSGSLLRYSGVLLGLIIAFIGMCLIYSTVMRPLTGLNLLVEWAEVFPPLIVVIIGVVLIFGGAFLTKLSYGIMPNRDMSVFDKVLGYYWYGSLELGNSYDIQSLDEYCSFSEIHAIQVTKIFVEHSDTPGESTNSYGSPLGNDCYEINIVLVNKTRLNIVSHGHLESITEYTKKLSEFLNVPVYERREPNRE